MFIKKGLHCHTELCVVDGCNLTHGKMSTTRSTQKKLETI